MIWYMLAGAGITLFGVLLGIASQNTSTKR